MFIIEVDSIRKGMFASAPVYSQNGMLLIAKGARLEERHIPLLKKAGVEVVEVSLRPPPAEEPGREKKSGRILGFFMDQNGQKTEPADKTHVQKKDPGGRQFWIDTKPKTKPGEGSSSASGKEDDVFYSLLKDEMSLLIKNSLSAYASSMIKNQETYDMIEGIFRDLAGKRIILDYLLDVKSADRFTYRHSFNVAVLSLLTASDMGFGRNDMHTIALGALFHDVGKRKVPHEILFSEGALSPQDKLEMEKHTTHGYETLIRLQDFPEESALIALQHHERIDGSGYPFQIKRDEIHPFSQIVGIADIYEAMTSERSYRKKHNPSEIAEYLMAVPGTLFDEEVVKALLKTVSIIRIGSVVQLSNGECGMVIQSNANLPTRPVLRIIFDRHGLKVRRPIIVDLSAPEHTTLQIVRSFG